MSTNFCLVFGADPEWRSIVCDERSVESVTLDAPLVNWILSIQLYPSLYHAGPDSCTTNYTSATPGPSIFRTATGYRLGANFRRISLAYPFGTGLSPALVNLC
jgi:hypothetical protein